ncbi:MAG: hypothetical protein COB33_002855, partial [Thiotrichaceae bacterium]|nr:hypothetical protein [Thiotrichaceae bacterium]
WGYNEIGRVVSKFDYQNVATKFTYDNTGRLIAMANKDYVQASYHYDAAGRLLSRILSNGAATLYNYDKDGFLTKITQRSSSGDIIDERSYTQDSVGNITQVAITGGDTTDYLYDPAYRLTQVNASDVTNSQTFSYDGVGNRLSKTHNSVTSNYTYSVGNRLDALKHGTALVFSYDYDDNGSRINKRNSVGTVVESYVYNQKRLITQMNSAGSVTDFAYDPNLYRIQKSSAAGTNNYLLEAEHLESVYDENNQLKSSYLRGVVVDEIINGFERDANGNWLNRTFHHDQVNSVLALSDHNGATAQQRAYTPFGLDLSSSGESTNSLAYTGREQDNESGLYYYRARYYDPEVGRFISEDPLGFEAGINFYAYVNNNPVNFNDPMGLEISATYFQDTGGLFLFDLDTGHSITVHAESGGQPFGDPIELGSYEILERAGRDDFFRLDAMDSLPRDDIHQPTGRDAFRLHLPGRTVGCIAVCTMNEWIQVNSMLEGTATTVVQDNFQPWWDIFGVTDAGDISRFGQLDVVNTPDFAIPGSSSFVGPIAPTGASGGFVLYPNRLNLNMTVEVYSK